MICYIHILRLEALSIWTCAWTMQQNADPAAPTADYLMPYKVPKPVGWQNHQNQPKQKSSIAHAAPCTQMCRSKHVFRHPAQRKRPSGLYPSFTHSCHSPVHPPEPVCIIRRSMMRRRLGVHVLRGWHWPAIRSLGSTVCRSSADLL